MMDLYLPVFFAIVVAICLFYYLLWRVPLVIRLLVERYGEHARAEFQVGWGLFGMRMTYTGGEFLLALVLTEKPVLTLPSAAKVQKIAPGIPQEKPEAARRVWQPGNILKAIGLLHRLWQRSGKLRRAARRAVSLERLDCDLTIGLSGAAETGRFFGAYSAVRPFLFVVPAASIEITPVFTRPVFEGRAECRIRVARPLTLALLATGLALTPEFRELAGMFRQGGVQ
jgi:hypothetical protein